MSLRLLADSQQRPDLFHWQGRIDALALDRWLEARGWSIPADLKEVWRRTGGGELFESESLLAPFADRSRGDDIDSVNAAYRRAGMPISHVIFHLGVCLSAVRLLDGIYVTLEPVRFGEVASYRSLDDWYRYVIREEYAHRYGI